MLRRLAAYSFFAVLALGAGRDVSAQRLFGNASFSYEYIRQVAAQEQTDNLTRESAVISYEDVLFYKNQLRLTANLQRREFSFTSYHEFIPIYTAELRSYGYTFGARYSPFTRRSILFGTDDFVDVHHRDWRLTGLLNYDRWPTLSLIYSRLRNYDDLEVHRFDGTSHNLVAEASYSRWEVSTRANYSERRRRSGLPGSNDSDIKTYSGTVSSSRLLGGLGYASANYNYYDSRRFTNGEEATASNTHSVSSLVRFAPVTSYSLSASYSGRFFESSRLFQTINTNTQNMSLSASYVPTGYLTVQAVKAYQITSQLGDNDIVEYLTVGGTLTRYVRRGVDSRFTYNRTMFQQSLRTRPVFDSVGAVVGSIRDDDYTLDTYQGALNFDLRQYIRVYLDVTLTHDSDPIDENRRYQLTRSLDTRWNISRRLETRFSYTNLYQGEGLSFTKSFSENYNLGVTYIPEANINLNVTYIYARFSGLVANRRHSLTAYASYAFRRVFTVYVSINDQTRTQISPDPSGIGTIEQKTRPSSLNAQLLMYLSGRATLALSYLENATETFAGTEITNESIQAVLTIQI